jgi:conjugal transfer pilin signal peptidase TrbI
MAFRTKFALVVMVSAAMFFSIASIKDKYRIGFDMQQGMGCLPSFIFLIDLDISKTTHRGDIVMFDAPDEVKYLKNKNDVVKIIVGVEGDHIKIVNGKTFINDIYINDLHLWSFYEDDESAFERSYTLNKDEFFVIGSTPAAVDSRYFGPINTNNITGVVYAVL